MYLKEFKKVDVLLRLCGGFRLWFPVALWLHLALTLAGADQGRLRNFQNLRFDYGLLNHPTSCGFTLGSTASRYTVCSSRVH